MPQQISSFQKDLVTPGAGTDSELYRAISPLIELDRLPEAKTKFDQERLEKLKNDLRQGTLGLEYLTGLKNNKVETFFDAHPVQATVSNVLDNSGRIGLGVAAGGPMISALRQWKNLRRENAFHSRRKDPAQEAGQRLTPTTAEGKPKGTIDEDILRMFGDGRPQNETEFKVTGDGKQRPIRTDDIQNIDALKRRAQVLDYVAGSSGKPPSQNFQAELENILKIEDPKQRLVATKMFMEKTRGTKAYGNLKHFVDLHTDLQGLRDSGGLKGGFGSPIGDRLFASDKFNNLLNKLPVGLQAAAKSVIPHSQQGVEDMIRKRILMSPGVPQGEPMVQDIIEDVYGANVRNPQTRQDKVFRNAVLGATGSINNQQRHNRLLRTFGGPALMGAGIAGAGLGLNEVLKLIQSKVYGKDKIKEWKRNALKAKGEFEEAERIK
jgi:hypothetical protein